MTKSVLIIIERDKARIVSPLNENIKDMLCSELGYMQKVASKEGATDMYGRRRLKIKMREHLHTKFNTTSNSFPVGMLDRTKRFFKNKGFTIKVKDKRPKPQIDKVVIAERLSEFPMTLRPYQIDAVAIGISRPMMVFHVATGGGKCLDSSALVLTDQGILEIGDLVGTKTKEKRITIHGKDCTERTSHLYYGGIKDTINITTQSGIEICGTHEHPLLTFDGNRFAWRKLSKIKSGDFVCINRGTELWGHNVDIDTSAMPPLRKDVTGDVPTRLTTDLCSLIGLIVGDGSVGVGRSTVSFFNDKRNNELKEWYTQIFARYFRKTPAYRSTSDNGYSLVSSSRKLGAFFRDVLRIYDEDENKQIPECIMRSERELVLAFIRGLFEADGECYETKVCYSSKSKKLIRQIQTILINTGIVPRVRMLMRNGEEYRAMTISGHNADKFMHHIGFITDYRRRNWNPPKQRNTNVDIIPNFGFELQRARINKERSSQKWRSYTTEFRRQVTYDTLNKMLDTGFVKQTKLIKTILSRNYFFDMIKDRSDGPTQEVFDLSVPESHSFTANGIVNHNSIMLSAITHALNMKTLVLINRSDLLSQHFATLKRTLNCDIGIIQGTRLNYDNKVCVATVQTLYSKIKKKDKAVFRYLQSIGYIVSDEVHHAQSESWKTTIRFCTNAIYKHGFSGTPWDHSSSNIELEAVCGAIKYRATTSDLIRLGYLAKPIITFHRYRGNGDYVETDNLHTMYDDAIVNNAKRNKIIIDVVMEEYNRGYKMLLVVNRIAHGEILSGLLRQRGVHDREIGYLHGSKGKIHRERGRKEFEQGEIPIMIVSQIWNEGIDLPSCDILVKADSYGGGEVYESEGVRNMVQQIGRVLRKPLPAGNNDVDTKKEHIVRVHDFADKQNHILERWTRNRLRSCKMEPEFEVEVI